MSEFLIAGGNTSGQAREWAEKEGLVVKVPKPYELFLDHDDQRSRDIFTANYDVVERAVGILNVLTTPSRSKPEGTHTIVTLATDVTPLERCLLQAVLGSDPRREGHSFCRIQDGDQSPTLFFEKP